MENHQQNKSYLQCYIQMQDTQVLYSRFYAFKVQILILFLLESSSERRNKSPKKDKKKLEGGYCYNILIIFSQVEYMSSLLLCIFHTRCSLQSYVS